MTTIVHNWSMIASGLLTTLVISVTAYAGALVLGSLLAVCRVGPLPPLRLLAATWVTVATNVPVLCSMILLGLGIPRLGVHITLLWAAVVAVVLPVPSLVTVPVGRFTVVLVPSVAVTLFTAISFFRPMVIVPSPLTWV